MASWNKNNKRNIRCETCKNEFEVVLSRIGRAKYCSFECRNKGISEGLIGNLRCLNREPWNKGVKGIHLSPQTEWKKVGSSFWGTRIEYLKLHRWVAKRMGRPTTCNQCGQQNLRGREIHWANKSGKYIKKLSDWIRLCAKCHFTYDYSANPKHYAKIQ